MEDVFFTGEFWIERHVKTGSTQLCCPRPLTTFQCAKAWSSSLVISADFAGLLTTSLNTMFLFPHFFLIVAVAVASDWNMCLLFCICRTSLKHTDRCVRWCSHQVCVSNQKGQNGAVNSSTRLLGCHHLVSELIQKHGKNLSNWRGDAH